MQDLELPDDFKDFLRSGRELQVDASELEIGPFILYPRDELKPRHVYVSTYDTRYFAEDPHRGEGGYAVPVVPLIREGDCPDPYEYLLWVPGEKSFGCYDSEHAHLLLFPSTTWTDIENDPRTYLDALPSGDFYEVDMKPWEKYPWIAPGESVPE